MFSSSNNLELLFLDQILEKTLILFPYFRFGFRFRFRFRFLFHGNLTLTWVSKAAFIQVASFEFYPNLYLAKFYFLLDSIQSSPIELDICSRSAPFGPPISHPSPFAC